MTLDELKAEAKKFVYHLVKNTPKISLLPCPIYGGKATQEGHNCLTGKFFRRCTCCDNFDGYGIETHNEAKLC